MRRFIKANSYRFLPVRLAAWCVLAACCVLSASCSLNLTPHELQPSEDETYLAIQVSGLVPSASSSASGNHAAGNARTVWCTDAQGDMDFWLYGESRTGTFMKQVYLDGGNSTYTLIEKGDWTLTLAAYPASYRTPSQTAAGAFRQALLIDQRHLDLRRFSGTASFVLSTIGLETTGSGSIPVTFDTPENLDGFTVTAGIYRIEQQLTGEAVSEGTIDLSSGTGVYGFSNVPTGFYYFEVVFTRDEEIYEWREAVHVLPGSGHNYGQVDIKYLIS